MLWKSWRCWTQFMNVEWMPFGVGLATNFASLCVDCSAIIRIIWLWRLLLDWGVGRSPDSEIDTINVNFPTWKHTQKSLYWIYSRVDDDVEKRIKDFMQIFFSYLFTAFQLPRIVEHPSDTTVPKNEPHTMNCVAEGSPSPAILWFKDGAQLKVLPHRLFLPQGGLFFLKVSETRWNLRVLWNLIEIPFIAMQCERETASDETMNFKLQQKREIYISLNSRRRWDGVIE